MLRPALLPLLHAWLDPDGSRGWRDDDGTIANAEALCAVLSLYRFLLLRESALGSNLTGAGAIGSCELFSSYGCPGTRAPPGLIRPFQPLMVPATPSCKLP